MNIVPMELFLFIQVKENKKRNKKIIKNSKKLITIHAMIKSENSLGSIF